MEDSLVLVACTWNLGIKDVAEPSRSLGAGEFGWLAELCARVRPTLVMLGLQEVHPSKLPSIRDSVLQALGTSGLEGLFEILCIEAANSYSPLLVFERRTECERREVSGGDGVQIESLHFSFDSNEVCSKGCVSARFLRTGVQLCLANAHLEAGHAKLRQRNEMQSKIEASLASVNASPSLLVLVGDLNYRIEGEEGFGSIKEPTKSRPEDGNARFDAEFEQITNLCEAGMASERLFPARCQLRQAMLAGTAFKDFEEAPVTFQPTYKRMAVNMDEVNLKPGILSFDRKDRRLPGWCDRVLWRREGEVLVSASDYDAVESADFSDHRPVHVVLRISTPALGCHRSE
ncbi:unnamed protein product [Polarella glacialis]|uniref:Inositol polyphosphate-related phosphatase domain-containing protein n=1 Tax=Polarella glacialis TaxID=89957 RepID=A0A813I0W4_POLGL|nr:unnamed protein product [Polarella glacialis]